ncbi:class I mannose-6-phosphate isomerase [Alicyclobacillus curvatus]|nr:class I mannose-6-phosphate isomerase [Alicyclobacillus curvatus]
MFARNSRDGLPDGPVGEYWVLSGHPNGVSIASNGPYQGYSLVELTEMFPTEYLGESMQPRFPLLIKFLEAADDLSVQVHPSDDMAQAVERDYGKTEAWYVLESDPNGQVVYGHNFSSREELKHAFETERVAEYLHYQPIHPRDTVFVPSQTLHALLKGTKVIEVQQTSDVTYRVYDWDRVGIDGSPRELHIDKAADVLFDDQGHGKASGSVVSRSTPRLALHASAGNTRLLVDCPYFTLYEWEIGPQTEALLTRTGSVTPDVIIVVEGTGTMTWGSGDQVSLGVGDQISLAPGDTCLIPVSLAEVRISASSGESSEKGPYQSADGSLRLLLARY